MAEIIETANNAYEERDKANDQIENLKSKAKREAKDFENELKDISAHAENNRKTLEIIKESNMGGHKQDYNDGSDFNSKQDRLGKSKGPKLLKDRVIDQNLLEEHKKLRLAFVKIQVTTDIKKFPKLIEAFKDMEEKNFKMFKYVIDLSNQIEFLDHQISELREEKKKFEGKGDTNSLKKNRYLKELDDKSLTSQQRAEYFETRFNSAQKVFNSIT